MTNPNNTIGTNGAFGGRTSVNALNDVLAKFDRAGIVKGWKTVPNSGMTVSVGAQDADIRDVAIAEDPFGNRTTVDNRLAQPVSVTIAAAEASDDRIDSIVAYVNSPAQVSSTDADNPSACGIIAVSGTSSAPDDAAIRAAITADGGTGTTAYYVVLANIAVSAGATAITSGNITRGDLVDIELGWGRMFGHSQMHITAGSGTAVDSVGFKGSQTIGPVVASADRTKLTVEKTGIVEISALSSAGVDSEYSSSNTGVYVQLTVRQYSSSGTVKRFIHANARVIAHTVNSNTMYGSSDLSIPSFIATVEKGDYFVFAFSSNSYMNTHFCSSTGSDTEPFDYLCVKYLSYDEED